MHLKNIAVIAATMVLSLTLLSSCSSGGSDANTNSAPTPEGVLLLGADDDPAVSAIIQKSSVPVDPSQIKTGGLLSTRLDAVINPVATVAEVNAALENVGAKIDGMTENNPIVVLSISEVADRAAAQAIADTLQANDAFFFVTVTFEAKSRVENINAAAKNALLTTPRLSAQRTAIQDFDWYQAAFFPALSRADVVANTVNQPVSIIIPSNYAAEAITDSSNIPNLSFLDGAVAGEFLTNYGDDELDPFWGSYGYTIASMIGVDDSTPLLSAYPKISDNLLKLYAAPLTGLSYTAIVMAIFQSTKDPINAENLNHKYILLTNHVYEDDDFSDRDRTWRAIDALSWRRAGGGFLHVTSVGELGESTGPASQAKYSSPFTISEAYPDLSLLLTEDPSLDFSSPAVAEFIDLRFTLSNPAPIGNLLSVGSSQINGFTRSDFSTPGADVRMIGENVTANCYTPSENCVENQWIMSDTGIAAAQIAALAAWMLNMDATLNETGVITVIKHAYQNGQLVGIVDTYAALLSLDTSISEAPIRKSILDVIDTLGTGVRDGVFDEGDIGYWFNTILPTFPDGLPFDLNGDGHIGGSDTAWFDLDINALPVYTTVTQTFGDQEVDFNEEAITDFDVLCYYAYSDLYTGDEAQRDALLLDACQVVPSGEIIFGGIYFGFGSGTNCQNEDATLDEDGDADSVFTTDSSELNSVLSSINGSSFNSASSGSGSTASSSATSSATVALTSSTTAFSVNATTGAFVSSRDVCNASAFVTFSYDFSISSPTNYSITGTLNNDIDAIPDPSNDSELQVELTSFSTDVFRTGLYDGAGGTINISEFGVLPPGDYKFRLDCDRQDSTTSGATASCQIDFTLN